MSKDHPEATNAAEQRPATPPVGRFHTWWRGDALPDLPDSPELAIALITDQQTAASLTDVKAEAIAQRMAEGHQFWLARADGAPVGWGWCATEHFTIGELGISRSLPPGNRYLWDFFTVPPARGQSIYPRLLQAVVMRGTEADRFWLGHDLDNEASRQGIATAGFTEVGLVYRQPAGGFLLIPTGPPDRATAASDLFGIPVEYPPPGESQSDQNSRQG